MDFDLDIVNLEEENEEGEGVNQTHSGEESNKGNQCDYASYRAIAGDLKRHLKRHSGEKSNKCTVVKSQANAHSQWRKVVTWL